MQLLNTLLAFATLLLPLVSAEACVAGGPASQVTFAKSCCFGQGGTWYQFYDVQAIVCVPLPCPYFFSTSYLLIPYPMHHDFLNFASQARISELDTTDDSIQCVFPDSLQGAYRRCVAYIPHSQLDTTCIPGNGGGLTVPGATATSTDRITFTGGSSPTVTARSFES